MSRYVTSREADLIDEVSALRAEVERLREAMHSVLNLRCSCNCYRAQDIARTALASSPAPPAKTCALEAK